MSQLDLFAAPLGMAETVGRVPLLRASFLRPGEIAVDSFAGGGGTSCGFKLALNRSPDIAINHDAQAIAMHAANHPETKHYTEDVWKVDPREACGSNPVGVFWASPDCTQFSKAKGGKPVKKNIRGLAWVVTRWARTVRPRIILLENVEEFEDWGPLGDDSRPIPEKLGRTFRAWVAQLRNLGYEVQWRLLVAADYGTPTIRKRLYLIARCDGEAIIWPESTHGKGCRENWLTAGNDVIQWEVPGRSIFGRPKALAEATERRIAMGFGKFVFNAADPFVMPVEWSGADNSAYIEPFLVRHGHYSTKTGAGLRSIPGGPGVFRGQSLRQPLATVCATNDKHIVCPVITKHYGGPNGHQTPGTDVRKPLSTVTARDHHAISAAWLTKFYGTAKAGQSVTLPVPTVTGQGQHIGECRAFLIKYYGAKTGQHQSLFAPLHTVTSKTRFGLVEVHGEPYQLADITLRTLIPRELYRAQGFPDSYIIDIEHNGKPLTKEAQIRMAGNSVCQQVAAAIIRANVCGERAVAA
jgi:DNA (cytosine-5)-methyltransferase 1